LISRIIFGEENVSDPGLYRLLTFHMPNLKSLFHSMFCTKESVEVRGLVKCFVTSYVFTVRCS
jgi:hypothetical protein